MPHPRPNERVEERPLPLKRRGDLIVRRVPQRNGAMFVIKDPIALRYFQLGAEEAWVFERLDGARSLAQICREFASEFPPRRIDTPQLEALLHRFRADNLLLVPGTEQAQVLCEQGTKRLRRQRVFAWLQPWAIRFRGFDPSRLLDSWYPAVRWMFTPAALACGAIVVAFAVLLALTQLDALTAKLPPLEAFLRLENAVSIALALCVVKILHELGHGLVGRHFGVRCNELGVMLLAGVPCLYCNVTDAWLLSDRWQRVAIGAAGIAVELLLASAALFLWWLSAPGAFNTFCLSMLVVCSVGTIVFNGNPLLRYDGYYILSDALAIPNLRDESIARVEDGLLSFFCGVPPREHVALRLPRWLPWYAIASLAYSTLVLVALAWLCHQWLQPWGAGPLVLAAAITCAAGMVVPSVSRMVRVARMESLAGQPVLRRFAFRGGLIAFMIVAFAFVPLPARVRAPGVLMPREGRQLYVLVAGQIAESLPAGTKVAEGDTVIKLINHRLLREEAKLLGEERERRERVAHLEQLSVQDDDASLRLPAAREALADASERLRICRLDLARLEIKSPIAGVLVPAAPVAPSLEPNELPTWSGSALDAANRGATLLAETVIGSVGDPQKIDVLLACDEADVAFLAVGQTAKVVIDQFPGLALGAKIAEIAPLDMETAPIELSARNILPTRREGPANSSTPLQTLYQVRLELDGAPPGALVGGTARAAIRVAPQSFVTRTRRLLARTFSGAKR